MGGALEGIRVIDLTRLFAGPFCTMLLGDLGAEVIKIEEPQSGDWLRGMMPLIKGQNYIFFIVNRNKKDITLNLKSEKGKELFKELVSKGDVVVDNFSPGVMERLGLGYEELARTNPGVIFASATGFGQTGPYHSYPAYDNIIQAMSGMMSVTGYADSPPLATASALVDFHTATFLALSILAALRYKEKTGRGQRIDISMHDCAWTLLLDVASFYFMSGKVPPRRGNRYPLTAPANSYQAKDGYVLIHALNQSHWESLLRIMGKEHLGETSQFATPGDRAQNADQVDALVGEWTRNKAVDDVLAELNAAHVPCAPIWDIDKVANDSHTLSRKMVVDVEQPGVGCIKTLGTSFKLSETPGEIRSPAPSPGQHNEEIYCGLLGYSKGEIAGLREEGII